MYTNRSKDLEMRKNFLKVHLFKRDAFGFIFRRASSLGSDQISSSDRILIMVFADHVWIHLSFTCSSKTSLLPYSLLLTALILLVD